MNNKKKLREKIIKKAGELFRKNGYVATSNKQIAKAAGCTTAALYYYFEHGKSHILREVIHANIEDPSLTREQVKDSKDLDEFLMKLTEMMVKDTPRVTDNLVWLLLEFPKLPKEERTILQEHIIAVHNMLEAEIRRFVADDEDVANLVWINICSYFGFYQLFRIMGISSIVGLEMREFGNTLTKVLSRGINR